MSFVQLQFGLDVTEDLIVSVAAFHNPWRMAGCSYLFPVPGSRQLSWGNLEALQSPLEGSKPLYAGQIGEMSIKFLPDLAESNEQASLSNRSNSLAHSMTVGQFLDVLFRDRAFESIQHVTDQLILFSDDPEFNCVEQFPSQFSRRESIYRGRPLHCIWTCSL